MKILVFLSIAFLLFFSGTSLYERPVSTSHVLKNPVFTYTEPTLDISLQYEVLKDLLITPFLTPNVPFTRLRPLRDYRVELGEELPAILHKSFSCFQDKIAITPHDISYNFRDYMKLLDLDMQPIQDTIFTYTSRYCANIVMSEKGYFDNNKSFTYYEFTFYNVADGRLIYKLGYVHHIGFVSVRSKVITPEGKSEMRHWKLEKINGIPIRQFLSSAAAKDFSYFNVWGQ